MQIFSWIDIPLVFFVFVIEVLLAADNAAAMALIVKKLDEQKRKRALFTGLISAFAFRLFGVIFAAFLIHLFWMQFIGGVYLVYLAWHCIFAPKSGYTPFSPTSYRTAVFYVELVDILFAIDSILGAFALVGLYYPLNQINSKLWIIYLGGVLGVFTVRIMTRHLLKVIDKYKKIEKIVFFVVGWMGIKLIAEGATHFLPEDSWRHSFDIFFWAGTFVVILIGFLSTKWKKKV